MPISVIAEFCVVLTYLLGGRRGGDEDYILQGSSAARARRFQLVDGLVPLPYTHANVGQTPAFHSSIYVDKRSYYHLLVTSLDCFSYFMCAGNSKILSGTRVILD